MIEKELVSKNAQEIVLDGSNKVSFPGFPYIFTALGEKILVTLDQFKSGYECKTCRGQGKVISKITKNLVLCPSCEGKSVKEGGIIIPDTAKMLANSGVVVSMGAKAKELCTEYKLGDRVLFSAHAGSLIPTRAGIAFKYMDWYQPIAKVDGAEDLASFDFIVPEDIQL
jgi:co-chaperonin GroES (HSP10)